jgi:cephalosporin hydroxylase
VICKVRALIGSWRHRAKAARALRETLHTHSAGDIIGSWQRSLTDPTGYYLDCVRFFHSKNLPASLKEHRSYFVAGHRGFGEDAFHVMWWMLFREFRPARFLEIGVYRGQTLSLAALLQRELGINGSVTGISPFTASGDTVSRYREQVDYLADTKANFAHFGLVEPELVQAFSTDMAATERVERESWDAIYIDGNHDYEVAHSDWNLCAGHLAAGGLIVLDDSAINTAYRAPAFATAGHPGPSRVALEVNMNEFREILRVGHNRVFQKTT